MTTGQPLKPFKERRQSPGRKQIKRKKKQKPTPIQKRKSKTKSIIAVAKLEDYRVRLIIKKFKQTKRDLEKRLNSADKRIEQLQGNAKAKELVKALRVVKNDISKRLKMIKNEERRMVLDTKLEKRSNITKNIISKARD